MKKIIILIPILIILTSINCLALDSSIWYQFPVPEYSYSHAYLSPLRILDWEIHGKNSEVNVGGNVVYDLFLPKRKEHGLL